MQRRTSKLSRIALAIAVSLASRPAGANPTSRARVEALSPSAPLSRTAVHYDGMQGALALPSRNIMSRDAREHILIAPRDALEATRIPPPATLAPTPVPPPATLAPTPVPPELVRIRTHDAPAPTHVPPLDALNWSGLSNPVIMRRFTEPAPGPRVTIELLSDGTGILLYTDHGVGIPIQLAGKPTNEHAARNFAAVAYDRRLSFPRSLQIDAEYGVDAELADGSHAQYTDDAIRALVPPEHVLRMKPSSRRVAAR